MRAEQENWGNTVKERLFDQRGAVVVHWLILLNVVIFFLGFFFQVEVPRDIYPPGRLDLAAVWAYSEYMFHEGNCGVCSPTSFCTPIWATSCST